MLGLLKGLVLIPSDPATELWRRNRRHEKRLLVVIPMRQMKLIGGKSCGGRKFHKRSEFSGGGFCMVIYLQKGN